MVEIIIGAILVLLIFVFEILGKIKEEKGDADKRESINSWSYKRYARFFGKVEQKDEQFQEKIDKIVYCIRDKKMQDLEEIAGESGCTLEECVLKIQYLKNKRVLDEKYYIDSVSKQLKVCSKEEQKMLQKYSPFLYHQHCQIPEIAAQLTGKPEDVVVEKIRKDILYLLDKGLINGVLYNEVDDTLHYYTIEKHKLEKEMATLECPNCGALNDVNYGTKKRCEYCGTIIVSPKWIEKGEKS